MARPPICAGGICSRAKQSRSTCFGEPASPPLPRASSTWARAGFSRWSGSIAWGREGGAESSPWARSTTTCSAAVTPGPKARRACKPQGCSARKTRAASAFSKPLECSSPTETATPGTSASLPTGFRRGPSWSWRRPTTCCRWMLLARCLGRRTAGRPRVLGTDRRRPKRQQGLSRSRRATRRANGLKLPRGCPESGRHG